MATQHHLDEWSFHAFVSRGTALDPAAPAILAPGRRPLLHGELEVCLAQALATLRALGVGKATRVAVVLPAGPDAAVSLLAVLAGAVCVPLSAESPRRELETAFQLLRVDAVLVPGPDAVAAVVARERDLRVITVSTAPDAPAGRIALLGTPTAIPSRDPVGSGDDLAMVMSTSGTTSTPKVVALTHTNLVTGLAGMIRSLELGPADRCLAVMPLFHIHGLSMVASPIASGGSVVCPPVFFAADFFRWLDELRPTWYSASPTLHLAVVEQAPAHAEIVGRARLRFVRCGTSAMAPRIAADLERLFRAPLLDSYGMTEAATTVACMPLDAARRKPGSVGYSCGSEIAIASEDGRRLPPGEVGEIIIRGPAVIRAYENAPEVNAAAFHDGWLRTGDLGRLDADGCLFLAGRSKELINRGGEKIMPREIDEALLEHGAVAEAVAFAVPDVRLGEDVAVAVRLRAGVVTDERELHTHLGARLAPVKVPRRIVFVGAIPKGPTGKPLRRQLAELLGIDGAAAPAAPYVAPRDDVEGRVLGIWREVLESRPELGIDDDFFAVGGDSLKGMRILARVRAEYDVDVSLLSLFDDASTVARLAKLIREERVRA